MTSPAPRRIPAWSLSAVLAVLYLILDPPSADLSAQTYRAWIYEHAGLAIWDNAWYAGHHLPGYSVLFPPLAGWFGPRVVGAVSAVAAAYLDALLAAPGAPDWARLRTLGAVLERHALLPAVQLCLAHLRRHPAGGSLERAPMLADEAFRAALRGCA